VRQRSVLPAGNEDRLMQYFVPFSQIPVSPFGPNPTRIRGLMLRVSSNPGRLAPIVRRAVVGDRTDLPFVRVRPYAELLERQMRPWSMGTRLLLLFSTLAVSVAAIGLYAAFAHAVAERRREMAIRLAIGAESSAILRMVLSDALVLTATGSVIGCAAAAASGRWVQSLLFGTQPWDPSVLGGAAAAMLIVALLATFKPAREASRTDPSQLLRSS
jgi:ABC-type lipoprotein release transport system permease subunit